MIWKENNDLNALGYILIGSILCLAFPLWEFLTNWHDFQGLYLTDLSQLKTTQAAIVSSYVYTSEGRKRTTYYHCQITYAYRVNGMPFQSDEVTFGNNYSVHQEWAERCRAQYPLNAIVTVYYDPKSPSFAVLEPQGHDDFVAAWLFLYLSVIGFFLSAVIVVWKWRAKSRKHKT